MCTCVCVCVRESVCVCAHLTQRPPPVRRCVRVCERERERVCVCVHISRGEEFLFVTGLGCVHIYAQKNLMSHTCNKSNRTNIHLVGMGSHSWCILWKYSLIRDRQAWGYAREHTATPCNTLQHTATHCNTLQHTATHCNTLQHTATTWGYARGLFVYICICIWDTYVSGGDRISFVTGLLGVCVLALSYWYNVHAWISLVRDRLARGVFTYVRIWI